MKKNSRQIPLKTLKRLLAKSGNQCAFPDCQHELFTEDDVFVAQLCHIEAVSPEGQRYNKHKSVKETNAFDNLLFLCYKHHKITDDVVQYTVEQLQEIKAAHEAKYQRLNYQYSEAALQQVAQETSLYWQQVEQLHNDHIAPEIAIPVDFGQNIPALLGRIDDSLYELWEANQHIMADLKATHFEHVCLLVPNTVTIARTTLLQVHIKYTEELLAQKPTDNVLNERLKQLRADFSERIQFGGISD